MIPHLLCYQGLAVDDYGFAVDVDFPNLKEFETIYD